MPNDLEYLIFRDKAVSPPDQIDQKVERFWLQVDLLSCPNERSLTYIKDVRTELHHRSVRNWVCFEFSSQHLENI